MLKKGFVEKIKIFFFTAALLFFITSDNIAQTTNNRAAWMQEAKWGVMVHYLADWKARENNEVMTVEKWNDMINNFDVEGFAEQMKAVGTGYVLFTIGQNSGYYLSPNSTYDKFVGISTSKCSMRDLIPELSDALNKRGIKLMVYLPSGAPSGDSIACKALEWKHGAHPNKNFQVKWEQVIKEWSLRWGDKIVGWWFDGCYWPNTMYSSAAPPNFQSFAIAARAGNPNSAIAFSRGVLAWLISITPYDDYTAGETINPAIMAVRRSEEGYVDGAQLHMLSRLGERWGAGAPRFTVDQIIEWSKIVTGFKGAVTWDVPIQKDGLISQPYIEQLQALARAINQN